MIGKIIGTIRVVECFLSGDKIVETGRVIDVEAPQKMPIVIALSQAGEDFEVDFVIRNPLPTVQ